MVKGTKSKGKLLLSPTVKNGGAVSGKHHKAKTFGGLKKGIISKKHWRDVREL